MRELLVAPGLDVDAIVLGPTGLWLFEVKHWSGKIVCRDGQWVRHKYYASGDYLGPEPIPDHRRFDRQWLREAKAVDKTLELRLSGKRKVWVPAARGGLVFSDPDVAWDLDDSCQSGYGDPKFWVDEIRKASELNDDFPLVSQLKVLDALVTWAHRLDDQLAACSHDAEALAKDLHDEVVAAARDYVSAAEGVTS